MIEKLAMFEIETLPKNLLSQTDSKAQEALDDIVLLDDNENLPLAILGLNFEGALKDSKSQK
ncbi:MAG: hypothetical protein ONB31_04285 [candidate division KSB1 bacterium]|nr:hypothetical protein [candidate division KSB1 bacterium]MDZ7358198.1 hypothetical protein [candidate division KSB1 bacterium]